MACIRIGLASIILIAILSAAPADQFHFVNSLIGERAAGLGGAYTAVSDGPEGAYYNPAGLSFTSSRYFSLSTNALQFKRLAYKDIWAQATTPVNYLRDSFLFVPSFFGFIQRSGRSTFAFTIAIPDNEAVDQRDVISLPNSNDFSTDNGVTWTSVNSDELVNVNFLQQSAVTEAGPSLSLLAGDRLSFGGSVFVTYADRKYVNNTVVNYNRTDNGMAIPIIQTTSFYSHDRVFGIRPQFGVQWMASDMLSLGLNAGLQLPLFAQYDDQSSSFTYIGNGWYSNPAWTFAPDIRGNAHTSQSILANGLFENGYAKTALGVAFFPSRSLLISTDLSAVVPFVGSGTRAEKQNFTWNAAAGVEWYMTPNFPLRFGLYTDNSSSPLVVDGDMNQRDHVDRYGATMSFGYSTAQSSITIGLSGTYGMGKAQIIADDTRVNQLETFGYAISISGGYQL